MMKTNLSFSSFSVLASPLFISGIYCYMLLLISKNELYTYMHSLIFLMYLFSRKGKIKKNDLLLIVAFLFPSILRYTFLYMIGIILFFQKSEHLIKRNKITKLASVPEKLYLKVLFVTFVFFISFLIFIRLFQPIIMMYYRDPFKEILNLYLGIYLTLIILIFVFWVLVLICLELVRISFSIQESEGKLQKTIVSYLIIVLILFTIPDILFSILYSLTMTIFVDESYTILTMYYYSFILHFLIPMNSYYLSIQNEIQQSFVFGFINGIHVYATKIIDSIVVSAIIVSLFSSKLMSFLKNDISIK
jgi:hypothetical protein